MNKKRIRIYTENKNIGMLESAANAHFGNYTMYYAHGMYNGSPEESVIVEVICDDAELSTAVGRASFFASDVCVLNQQECCLITVEDVQAFQVGA